MVTWISSLLREWTPRRRTPSKQTPQPRPGFRVEVSDLTVTSRHPDGQTETVQFSELAAVILETNDRGPWESDVWWILIGQDLKSGCVFPGDAPGADAALTALQRLPGFDNEAVIRAMGTCEPAQFLCWQRNPAQ